MVTPRGAPFLRTWVKRLSAAAAAGMFLVLVMGATVTSTGSGEGCGRSWPLCRGELVPELALATLIEYSHRAISGLEGVLVLGLTAGARAVWRDHPEVRILAPLSLFTTVLQAGLGAWAVLYPQSPAALAAHFGVSLVCLASVFLLARCTHEADSGADALRDHPPPARFAGATWGILAYVLAVVYLGAYVRHADAALACDGWPLCGGRLFPGLGGRPAPPSPTGWRRSAACCCWARWRGGRADSARPGPTSPRRRRSRSAWPWRSRSPARVWSCRG